MAKFPPDSVKRERRKKLSFLRDFDTLDIHVHRLGDLEMVSRKSAMKLKEIEHCNVSGKTIAEITDRWTVSAPICNVKKVWALSDNDFNFLVGDSGAGQSYFLPVNVNEKGANDGLRKCTVCEDVPADREKWLEFKCTVTSKDQERNISFFRDYTELVIHLHSLNEINGAKCVADGKTM